MTRRLIILSLSLLVVFVAFLQLSPSLRFLNRSHLFDNKRKSSSVGENHDWRGTCPDLDALTKGSWDNLTKQWHPVNCMFTPFTKASVHRCLSDKRISFYGDSTLKAIANALIRISNATDIIKLSAVAGSDKKYKCGGGVFGHNTSLAMWWTPSAYYQIPPAVGTMSTDDISIISIAAWDMGVYYRGVNSWFTSMRDMIQQAAVERKGRPLYVMNLHRVYKSKCQLKHDSEEGRKNLQLCLTSKCDDLIFGFRDALAAAVKCSRIEGHTNVHLIDTYGVTDSSFGEEQSNGVHFGNDIVDMELQVVLLAICNGLRKAYSVIENMTCPASSLEVKFEQGRKIPCE